MRLKKGFTLAEVLIVLMVIGAIATLTIPSLMQSVGETQWKTSFKKAYNTVVNVYAMQRITGTMPGTGDARAVATVFQALRHDLAVKDYAKVSTNFAADSVYTSGDYYDDVKIKVGETVYPGVIDSATEISMTDDSPWINTEDGISYMVTKGGSKAEGSTAAVEGACDTKTAINATSTASAAFGKACVVIVVDVNGLTTGPNALEPQVGGLTAGTAAKSLTGDRYYVYIGRDGVASGSRLYTIMGRILADTD